MANKNGMTIKAGFERARAVFLEMGDEEMVAFFDKRLEQNAKKSASTGERKLTPRQQENAAIKEQILNNMVAGTIYSIDDMLSNFNCFPEGITKSRIATLLSQLGVRGSHQVVRLEEKGKAFYRLAEDGDYNE